MIFALITHICVLHMTYPLNGSKFKHLSTCRTPLITKNYKCYASNKNDLQGASAEKIRHSLQFQLLPNTGLHPQSSDRL